MITRLLYATEKDQYDALVSHPIQTWVWGDFQKDCGHQLFRLGVFKRSKMISAYSVAFHRIPHTPYSVGTVLRGPKITKSMLAAVGKLARQQQAIFVKFEPDVIHKKISADASSTIINHLPSFPSLQVSPKSAFYPHSYIIDLSKSEEDLLSSMHPKTRYNIKIANRYGVKVNQSNSSDSFDQYLNLIFDTTVRQGFYLHDRHYHRRQWQILSKTNIPHLISASYNKQTLSSFMLFSYQKRLFYPYGGSLDTNRQVMAPTLLMWEAIKFGKKLGCRSFDMWGSLGPDAKQGDPAFGFHRFKQGFGGQLVQFVGSYDLVINPALYRLYHLIDKCRWQALRLKASLPFLK
jgi:lipid II:glycine glycyltransferase (peptidoglycan interpeptide bridge formation enzyme)